MNGIQEVVGSTPIPSTSFEGGHRPAFFVYILQSIPTARFYIGHCDHLIERFHEHQAGYVRSTRNRGPWWMPYYEVYPNRAAAQKREYELKRKKSSKHTRWLIDQESPGILSA